MLAFYLDDILAFGGRLGEEDSTGAIRNINFISQSVFIFSTFTMYQVFFGQKNNKIFFILFIIQMVLIALSGTKRAIIGLAIFYIILTYIKYHKSFFKYTVSIILVIGLLSYLLINNAFLYEIIGFRIEMMLFDLDITQSIGRGLIDRSTEMRKELMFDAFNMTLDTPILGNGYAYFQTHSVGFNSATRTYHSHNEYLELFINYGFIGFVLYYSRFMRTTYRLVKKKNKTVLTYFFLIFFLYFFLIIEPSSVTYYSLPIYYIYLYFAYMYSWERDSSTLSKNLLKV